MSKGVLVLGAGAVGTATAWYLRKAGYQVTVVERQPAAALETSWGNGGVIHASEVEPWSQPGMPRRILGWLGKEDAPLLLRYAQIPQVWRWGLAFARNCTPERFRANTLANLALALHSLRSLQEIRAETGIEYDQANRGVLKIYRSMQALDAAAGACEALTPHGLVFEKVDGQRCVELEPALASTGPTLAGGLYFPQDEVGDCNKFTQGLAGKAAEQGVRFRFGETVQELQIKASRIEAVVTDQEVLPADQVVVALGSHTAPLLRRCGLSMPIEPVKGVSITFLRGGWNAAPAMPVIDDSRLFGLVPIGDRLRISGSAEIAGFDDQPARTRCQAIIDNAANTFPELRQHLDPDQARFWAGLRPVTPAGTPLMGRTPILGLWINAGHGHLGWTFACGSGRVVADLISGKQPAIAVPDGQGALAAA